jgi:hypothetical protein
MSHIISTQITTFVCYEIKPLPIAFKKPLQKYLLENVCFYRREVQESIYVDVDYTNSISAIRYQFGEDFDEDMAEEVGELIEKRLEQWLAQNNALALIED